MHLLIATAMLVQPTVGASAWIAEPHIRLPHPLPAGVGDGRPLPSRSGTDVLVAWSPVHAGDQGPEGRLVQSVPPGFRVEPGAEDPSDYGDARIEAGDRPSSIPHPSAAGPSVEN
jgi:hypothetical protein